ncbi:MAG: hypothetical protein HYV24_04195 [Deltaproteobacteria bacterium]|nr:hypothetical protein [Deltaproteobacteria bacterium]
MEQSVPIHPVALAFMLVAGSLMLALPRRGALVPLVFAIVFIPLQQRIMVYSLDFFIIRILILFGWTRVLMRGEYSIKLNTIDKLMVLWAVSAVATYTMLWQTWGAFINRLGVSFDIIGIYFLIRFLVRDFDDIVWVVKIFAFVTIPVAAAMFLERVNGRNLFSVFGGVPDVTIVRWGKMRCQGAFSHPITAGTFGAAVFPLLIALRLVGGNGRALMAFGAIAASVITLSTSSSGPLLGYLAGIAALCMWFFRDRMREFRWALALTLIALHLVMKAPVWALLARANVFGGSTGYHRFYLFDQFLRRFNEWWLFGVRSTADWGYYLFDVTNNFVRIGVDGGLSTLVIFIAILAFSFQSIGRAVRSTEDDVQQKIYWALGASLLVHVVSFFGVSYFDQIKVVLYMLLGMISVARSLSEEAAYELKTAPEDEDETVRAGESRSY